MTTGIIDELKAALASEWGVRVRSVHPVRGGRFNRSFRVDAAGASRFVKVYAPFFDLRAIRRTLTWQARAAESGVATPMPLSTRSGELVHTVSSGAIAVWPWIQGRTIAALSPAEAEATGILLGTLHSALIGAPADERPAASSRGPDAEALRALLDILRSRQPTPFVRFAAADLEYRLRAASRTTMEVHGLHGQIIHGDFGLENLIFSDAGPWTIDFDFARFGHPAIDLMRLVVPLAAGDWIERHAKSQGASAPRPPAFRAAPTFLRVVRAILKGYRSVSGIAAIDPDRAWEVYWRDIVCNPFPLTLLAEASDLDRRWQYVARRRRLLYLWLERNGPLLGACMTAGE